MVLARSKAVPRLSFDYSRRPNNIRTRLLVNQHPSATTSNLETGQRGLHFGLRNPNCSGRDKHLKPDINQAGDRNALVCDDIALKLSHSTIRRCEKHVGAETCGTSSDS